MTGSFAHNGHGDRWLRYAAPGALLILVALVYWPGLSGPFVFDDLTNIVHNPAMAMDQITWSTLRAAAASDESGYLPRWLPMVSIAIDHVIAGGFDHTFPYKLTNLLIHLGNTILVYAIAVRLARRLPEHADAWFALLATAIWALHPIQLTSVLYVVQRMTSMSALFVFAGLYLYLVGRELQTRRPKGAMAMMAGGLLGGMLLGTACKENAILLPLLALTTEWLPLRSSQQRPEQRRRLQLLFGVVLGIQVLAAIVWLIIHPDFIVGSYAQRDFSITERILTESRVLWYYLGLFLAPVPGRFGIYHDDFALSSGLLHPVTTVIAIVAWLAAAAAAWRWRRQVPLLGFGLFWFLAAHALESSLIGLELVHEHRNYVALFGPALLIAGCVGQLRFPSHSTAWRRGLLVAFILSATVATLSRAAVWQSNDTLIPSLARDHPDSERSQAILAEYLLHRRNDPLGAMTHLARAARLRPGHAAALLEIVAIAMQTQIDLPPAHGPITLPPGLRGLIHVIPMPRKPSRYTFRANEGLVNEINARLQAGKVGTDSSYQLARLTDCAILGSRLCSTLTPAIGTWYRTAIANPNTHEIARSWFALGLARLEVNTGHPQAALDALALAARLRKQEPEYWLLSAQSCLHAGKPEPARTALRHLHDAAWKLDAEQQARLDSLERRLAASATRKQ
jgi:hypothetical protein